ncbi:MAG: hypothetical protein OHK0039_09580 [Bacteroidia bacterium]
MKHVPAYLSLRGLLLALSLIWITACKDPCKEVVCENGGTCVEGVCDCPEGYVGANCERFDLAQLPGTYRVAYEGCFTTNDNHRVLLEAGSTGSQFVLVGLGDYACPGGEVRLTGTVEGAALAIPSQTIDCGAISYTFEGSGSVAATGQVSITFTARYDAGGFERTDSCVARLEK